MWLNVIFGFISGTELDFILIKRYIVTFSSRYNTFYFVISLIAFLMFSKMSRRTAVTEGQEERRGYPFRKYCPCTIIIGVDA